MNTREMRDIIGQMDYEAILEFGALLKAKKREFKPFRIKTKFKRCGKPDCTCMSGPADNEWGNLHGPFLSVQYQDKYTGKTKVLGLGRFHEDYEIRELGNDDSPKWYDFSISVAFYDKMSLDVQADCIYKTLDNWEFEAHYGVNLDNDVKGHPKRIMYNSAKYQTAMDDYRKRKNVWLSRWSGYGVGTVSGIEILDGLIDDNYYLKE